MLAILQIARSLDYPLAGFGAGLLYIGSPMAALHDRLVMSDTLLTFSTSLLLWASIKCARAKQPVLWQPLLVGSLLTLSVIVKLSGILLISMPVIAVLFLTKDRAERRARLLRLVFPLVIAGVVAAALVASGYGGFEGNKTSFGSVGQRIEQLWQQAQLYAVWMLLYLPAPILVPVGIVLLWERNTVSWRAVAFLACCGTTLILTFLLVGTTAFSRYLMPAWPALLLAGAISAELLLRTPNGLRRSWQFVGAAAVGTTLLWNTFFVTRLFDDPAAAPLAAPDRYQYVESWTAGYHLPEIMAALEAEARRSNGIVLAVKQRVRLINVAPLIYLRDNPGITIEMIDLSDEAAPQRLNEIATQRPVYLLLDQDELHSYAFEQRFPHMRLVRSYANPVSAMHFYLYSVASSR